MRVFQWIRPTILERKTSWADSREERKWVADEKETHDFLYKHKDDLDLGG